MKSFKPLVLPILFSIIIVGCATVPTLRVPQPWIRSLKLAQPINPNSKMKVDVIGTTTPLLGDEQLTEEIVREKLSYLLKRRGFTIDSSSPDYLVQLSYKSERSDKFRFLSAGVYSNVQMYDLAAGSGTDALTGLGVTIARAVSALATRSTTVSEQTVEQMPSYTHTIAIEIRSRDRLILWKGESTWDSNELNLISRIIPAMQLILSDLPTDQSNLPEIPEVKSSHVVNYYKLECEDFWFTCPALPYRILFEKKLNPRAKTEIPSSVKDQYALAAYVDLIQTAEYALPSGSEDDWTDPIQISLWEKVTIGGQYLLGADRKPVYVLIKLVGKSDGYYIDECKVASDEEFSKFSAQFSKWRQVLQDYYDVYVR